MKISSNENIRPISVVCMSFLIKAPREQSMLPLLMEYEVIQLFQLRSMINAPSL